MTFGVPFYTLRPSFHRCSIVTRYREGITVDGHPLALSNFTKHDDYWVAQLLVTSEYSLIKGIHPLCVTAYGWLGPLGYAYTPPWK